MNINEAVARACEEPTLLEALSWIAVWESERAIQQARRFYETGERTGANGAGWDTCFRTCFERVMDLWKKKHWECEPMTSSLIEYEVWVKEKRPAGRDYHYRFKAHTAADALVQAKVFLDWQFSEGYTIREMCTIEDCEHVPGGTER